MSKSGSIGNCLYCNLVGILIKIKHRDGLVWTIFRGRNPKVGVNHVNSVVSLYYMLCCFIYFCLHNDDDDYECNTNVSIDEKITQIFIFADFLNAL